MNLNISKIKPSQPKPHFLEILTYFLSLQAGAAPGAPGAPGAAPPSAAMVPPMVAQPGFGMVSLTSLTVNSLFAVSLQSQVVIISGAVQDVLLNQISALPCLCNQPAAGGSGVPVMQPMMGQPIMGQPMMRPAFSGVAGAAPGAAAPGPPVTETTYRRTVNACMLILYLKSSHMFLVSQLSPGPASQSPKKPKDPLADLDLKDFL